MVCEAIEARVVGDVVQDCEGRGGGVAAGAGEGGVVEVLVQGVVETGSEG